MSITLEEELNEIRKTIEKACNQTALKALDKVSFVVRNMLDLQDSSDVVVRHYLSTVLHEINIRRRLYLEEYNQSGGTNENPS